MHSSGQGGPLSSPGASGASGGLDMGAFAAPGPLVLEALSRHITPEQVEAALRGTSGRRRRRVRKAPASAVVWLVIAIGLWGDRDVPGLWRQVTGALSYLLAILGGRRPPCK